MKTNDLLEIKSLTKTFASRGLMKRKEIVAVDGVSFSLSAEKPIILTLAGESGSGKTTTARLILGFIKPTSGKIMYNGKDIWEMDPTEWKEYRREIQAIFQDPYAAFNPVHKIDRALSLPIRKFNLANSKAEEKELIFKALKDTDLKADEILGKYPHELSGGQRQRVMVSRAFLLKPKVVIADEPVSMIDTSLRANILNLMLELKEKLGISFLYITHDLSTARYISDEILIMYLGSIMEMGPINEVVINPLHPYVQLLIHSIPKPDPDERWEKRIDLSTIELDSLSTTYGKGCKFYPRCPSRMEKCKMKIPELVEESNRRVACFLYD